MFKEVRNLRSLNDLKDLENVRGGTYEAKNNFGTWVKYNEFKETLNSYKVNCPSCKNSMVIQNHHDIMNFSEYKECSGCKAKWLIRRFNGNIEIQSLG